MPNKNLSGKKAFNLEFFDANAVNFFNPKKLLNMLFKSQNKIRSNIRYNQKNNHKEAP